jgi:hypothetical protein
MLDGLQVRDSGTKNPVSAVAYRLGNPDFKTWEALR